MSFIGRALEQLEGRLESYSIGVLNSVLKPEWIDQILEREQRKEIRVRKLPAAFTIWLVLGLTLYRNLAIRNVLHRMGTLCGLGSLWEDGVPPSNASVAEARDRLGFGVLRALLAKLRQHLLERWHEALLWKGLLLLAMDGSTFKVPDSPANRRWFGLPGSSARRAAFPQMRALLLVSAYCRFILGACFAPYARGEAPLAMRLLAEVPTGSLVLLDRYFSSWQLLLGLTTRQSHFLLRAKKSMKGTPVQLFGPGDRLLTMRIDRHVRSRCPQLPRIVLVREISVTFNGKEFRFFTSLLDPKAFSANEVAACYAKRWQAELALDEVKIHQSHATTVNRPVIFRSKTPRRVLQEAYGLMLSYTLIRAAMAEAGDRQGADPLRISFVGTLEFLATAALIGQILPDLRKQILDGFSDLITRDLVPSRTRSNPREVCLKTSAYPRKRKAA